MANLKKPVSRLILLFILMVVVSGGILTFLSINNITNLRILTEKRIQETQLQIAGHISVQFQENINQITEEFSREVSSDKKSVPADFQLLNRHVASILPFVLTSENFFIYPWFSETGQKTGIKQSGSIFPDFSNGEADEFQKEDYSKAFVHYLSALSKSRVPGDSAKVLNALGRISSKVKQFDKAYFYYSSLFPNLGKELSVPGLPFSYFAISQLIKLPLPEKQSETAGLTGLFLEQMDKGIIPLNPGTKTILEEISEWLSKVQHQKESFGYLLESLNSKLDFIANYGSKIGEVIESGRQTELPAISENYKTFGITSGDHPELIVINTDRENPAGFVLSLKNLWDSVTYHLSKEIKSEYTINLVSGSGSSVTADELSARTELSPYFPLHRIVIRPVNEEVVEKFVKRRSWTYGIALTLLLGGMSLGIVLILRDIKREKKMADLQSEFVTNVTHELKTPLTSIKMFAETIFLDRAKTEEIRKKYANIIMKESEVLKRKIDNILEYSVRKNDSIKYRMKETNLTLLVGEVMDEMKYWLDINQFEVRTEIEDDIVAQVDPEAIKQALANLIGNAIKYSHSEKKLAVRLKKLSEKIIIKVEDQGIGIPKDQVSHIFEKFYRVKSAENETTTGTGLGLSVARDIVKAHNGEISVESEIYKGSKFTIWL